jgi:hypothetical protein
MREPTSKTPSPHKPKMVVEMEETGGKNLLFLHVENKAYPDGVPGLKEPPPAASSSSQGVR